VSSLPFELEFASFANYSSHGTTDEAKRSQGVCGQVKAANDSVLALIAKRLQDADAEPIQRFLAADRVLVPVPGSGKTNLGNLWVPREIYEALRAGGYVNPVMNLLERTSAVPKSAYASPGHRPTTETHKNSMRASVDLGIPSKITLVDDVITKGATSMGAALCLLEQRSDLDIKIFAVFRTCNSNPELTAFVDPKPGKVVYYDSSDAIRRIDDI